MSGSLRSVRTVGSRVRLRDWMPRRRWRLIGRVAYGDEVPSRLPRRTAVAVSRDGERPDWVAFDCPCARRHRVLLNMSPSRRPTWRLSDLHPMTILPSVDIVDAAGRCHYFIRDGRVSWARGRIADNRR